MIYMDLKQLNEHMDARFDRVEAKLDDYSTRLTRTETEVTQVRGQIRYFLTAGLTVIGYLFTQFYDKLFK